MQGVVTSAPGKALVSGEYAVLEGAPAIAMAVACRARVRVELSADGLHRVISPGFDDSSRAFTADGQAGLRWADDSDAGRQTLLAGVWGTLRPEPPAPLAISLDTRDFHDPGSGRKLGFGSSAALAVALTAALLRVCGRGEDVLDRSLAAHRRLQGGRGSGVDVAAAVRGGLIAYRARSSESLDWPRGLHHALLWSGRPAATAERLAQLAAARQGAVTCSAAARLASAAETVVEVWRRGSVSDILRELDRYAEELQRFGDVHGLGIYDGGHGELRELAVRGNLVYKPSGAGGGDIGVVFGDSAAAVARFCEQAKPKNFRLLSVPPDPRGLLYES